MNALNDHVLPSRCGKEPGALSAKLTNDLLSACCALIGWECVPNPIRDANASHKMWLRWRTWERRLWWQSGWVCADSSFAAADWLLDSARPVRSDNCRERESANQKQPHAALCSAELWSSRESKVKTNDPAASNLNFLAELMWIYVPATENIWFMIDRCCELFSAV